MKNYIIICLMALIGFTACEDTNERVFKQHLYKHLTDAEEFMNTAVEGSNEGDYREGSKAILSAAIDDGYTIYWDLNSTQEAVDNYCGTIDDALYTFKMSVNPSLANLRSLLSDAMALVESAKENGVAQDDINRLSEAVDRIQATINDSSHVWNQEEVIALESELGDLMGTVEEQMPGAINVRIENSSFEPISSGDEVISDFSLVPGWNNAGFVDGVTPWEDLLSNSLISKNHWMMSNKSVDGEYALYIQTYSKQVWQTLSEKVRGNSTYTVSINATRDQWKDAEKTKLLIQLVAFEGTPGDFSNATVLAQQEFANISDADFQQYTLSYTTTATTENIDKRITVCLRSYHINPANNSSELVWQDTGVTVDKITITREKNS
ncbi:hypothetical protein [uncultured Bacteroides sp.]|uniref:hypothetical protein n=1 Tax=uncultured Bacteroides sp. TaxID=162156 RepID=UPI0026143586|nr:hypothetical protein [uncultured Bacteroides sp.]